MKKSNSRIAWSTFTPEYIVWVQICAQERAVSTNDIDFSKLYAIITVGSYKACNTQK